MVEYLLPNLKVEGLRLPCAQILFLTPAENSGGAENSTEIAGPHAKNFFCSMYEMCQRHPVWVAENHVKPCNSVQKTVQLRDQLFLYTDPESISLNRFLGSLNVNKFGLRYWQQ